MNKRNTRMFEFDLPTTWEVNKKKRFQDDLEQKLAEALKPIVDTTDTQQNKEPK